jgi:hypothetical protein
MGKPIEKTALKGMMARVSARGLNALDRRSAGYKALTEWREALTRDLGGDLSTQERTLVELITRTKLFLDSIDLFLMEQPSLVNKKKRVAYGILATRNSMANTLANLLNQIGLKRREPPMKSLAEYLAEKESKGDEHPGDDAGPEVVSEDVRAEEEAVQEGD